MSKATDVLQMERLKRLASLPDDQIDTSDMPVMTDWSSGVRGGTPGEVRRKVAASAQPGTAMPTVRAAREQATSREVDHVRGTQRSWYRYDFKVGSITRHSGITQDPEQRQLEHRQLWPSGRIVILGAPVSACAVNSNV